MSYEPVRVKQDPEFEIAVMRHSVYQRHCIPISDGVRHQVTIAQDGIPSLHIAFFLIGVKIGGMINAVANLFRYHLKIVGVLWNRCPFLIEISQHKTIIRTKLVMPAVT